MAHRFTYAGRTATAVASSLRVIASVATLTTCLLDFLACALAVKERIGLESHHSEYKNSGDPHLELINKSNVDACSKMLLGN